MAVVSDLGYRWNPYYINYEWDDEDIQKYGRTIADVQNLVGQKKEDILKKQMQKYRTQVYDRKMAELANINGDFDDAAEILSGDVFNKIANIGILSSSRDDMWNLSSLEDIEALFSDMAIRYSRTVRDLGEFETQLNSVIAQYGEKNKKNISAAMRAEVVRSLLDHRDFKTSTPSGAKAKGQLMTAILNQSSENAFEAVSKKMDLDADIVKMIALVNDLKNPPDYSSYSARGGRVSGESQIKDALLEKFEGWMKHINDTLREVMSIKGMVEVHSENFQQELENIGIALKSDINMSRKNMDITTQVDTSEIDRFLGAMRRLGAEAKALGKTSPKKESYGLTIQGNTGTATLGVNTRTSSIDANAGRKTVSVKLHKTQNALRFLLLQAGFPVKYMTQLYRVLASRQGEGSPSLDDVFNSFKEWVKYNSLVNAIVGLHDSSELNDNDNVIYMTINKALFSVWDILNEIYNNLIHENVNTLNIDIKFYPNLVRKDYYQMNRFIKRGEKNKQKIIEYMNKRSDRLEAKVATKLMSTKVLVNLRFQDLKALASMVKLRG